jgi:xylulokinase
MPDSTYILAHDLGTTGNKATLFDATTGRAVASTYQAYPTHYPHAGWAEHDPADWQRAILEGTRTLLDRANVTPGDIAVLSFSGMMMGALPLDAEGEPLRSAILWADVRATEEADLLAQAAGYETVYRRTGHRPSSSYTGPKLQWIKRHQPEIYARACVFLQPKDYAAYLFSGEYATDYSDASGTNLFDLETRAWAPDLIAAAGLDADKLPPAYPSAQVIGHVTRAAAMLTGLHAGTPVVIGGGDGACATVGSGSVSPGQAYNYIGSSAWIAVTAEKPLLDAQMRTFTYVHMDPRYYFPTGTNQCAGGSFDWLERLLRCATPQEAEDASAQHIYDDLTRAAATVPPGARGLLFLPHLIGERSPYWDPIARGGFVGLTMAHGRAEMARAVLEGVALNLRSVLEAFGGLETEITAMRLIGGAARSPIWRQIIADVYGLPLLLPQLLSEATSLGAAIAGGVGVGLYSDYGIARQFVEVAETERPDAARHHQYDEIYALFLDAYRGIERLFPRLAALPDWR